MTTRQIIQLAGSLDIPGLPKLDVSQREIDIANMPSLKIWAAMAKWGVSADDLGFEDRVNGNKIALNGASAAARLVPAFDGQNAYSITGPTDVLKDLAFDTSGSFTIAYNHCVSSVENGAAGAGSPVLPTGSQSYWFVATAGGKFRIGTTSLFTQFADYVGPLPSTTAWLRFILKFDRALGTMTLYVNGVQQAKLTNDGLKTVSLPQGVGFGGIVTTVATPVTQPCFIRSQMAFNAALSDAELALVDRYLSETVY